MFLLILKMAIDACKHSFSELATTVLPVHMVRLEAARTQPWSASLFAQTRFGTASLAKNLKLKADFSGCYMLLDDGQPIYIGISRQVLQRLRQHMLGSSHFTATLAYRMAQHDYPTLGHRASVMKLPKFLKTFENAQKRLRLLTVVAVEIDCPVELYLFEVYAALAYGTARWNTFRTH